MTEQNIDLLKVFTQVSKTLAKNKETLNEADSVNHDHGDHMAETFQTITKAMKSQKGADASQMLQVAAQALSQNANNGSAQLYSQGLQKAAQEFQGKNVDAGSAMALLQTLLSAGQPATQQSTQQQSPMGNLLGSLLGGGQQAPQQAGQTPAGGDLLGSLLGGLTGSSQQQPASGAGQAGGGLSDGLDMGDLVTAGMAFFQSKQQGKTNMNALVDAFVAGSGMGSSPHRQQSTQLVVSTFMNAIGKK